MSVNRCNAESQLPFVDRIFVTGLERGRRGIDFLVVLITVLYIDTNKLVDVNILKFHFKG